MSLQSATHRLILIHEAMAPVSHMARSEGNESLVARESVTTPSGVRHVPVLSGNALRHRMLREAGARWLVNEYGLAGKLSLQQLNFLFHGGALTEGGGRENTARIADMQRLLPLYRLLGGCLPDQILAGSLQCGRGTLVCEENRPKLIDMLGGDILPPRLCPAELFIAPYQYVRGDAGKTVRGLLAPAAHGESNGDGSTDNQMIFAGQSVSRGAVFVQELVLPNVSILELGAALHAIGLWQAAGGTIGGQGARGHGILATSLLETAGAPVGDSVAAYAAHARAVKDEAIAWLFLAFAKVDRTTRSQTATAGKA